MKVGTGKPGLCLSNNSAGATSPEPSRDRGDVDPVRTSSRCVFLTCDLKDCMAYCERCFWVISQGMCIRDRPGARRI
jgi:hypothetical protein